MPTNCLSRPMTEPTVEEIVDRLREVDLFAGLDVPSLELIATLSELVRASAGCVLVPEHSSGDAVVIVLSGTVEVVRICERVAIVGAGAVLGEMAALGYGQRNATLLAGTDVEAVLISGPAFTSLLNAFPEAGHHLRSLVDARTP